MSAFAYLRTRYNGASKHSSVYASFQILAHQTDTAVSGTMLHCTESQCHPSGGPLLHPSVLSILQISFAPPSQVGLW